MMRDDVCDVANDVAGCRGIRKHHLYGSPPLPLAMITMLPSAYYKLCLSPLPILIAPFRPMVSRFLQPSRKSSFSCTWVTGCSARVGNAADELNGDGLLVGEYGERIIVPNYEEDEELGEIKLECDGSGCVLVMPQMKTLTEEDAGGYLRCDLTGCYFTEEPPEDKSFQVIEGQGWRLGYETAPDSEDSFSAVVGAGGWSIALTASEFNDFCQLIQTLRKGISTMDEDGLIGKDDIALQGCFR